MKGLEDAEDEFIENLIYHKMWNSDACWKTVREVSDGLRRIKTKSGKYASLKDNIRIRWKGLGWMECETRWTVDGHELTVPELAHKELNSLWLTLAIFFDPKHFVVEKSVRKSII